MISCGSTENLWRSTANTRQTLSRIHHKVAARRQTADKGPVLTFLKHSATGDREGADIAGVVLQAGSAQWNPDFTCSLDALQADKALFVMCFFSGSIKHSGNFMQENTSTQFDLWFCWCVTSNDVTSCHRSFFTRCLPWTPRRRDKRSERLDWPAPCCE